MKSQNIKSTFERYKIDRNKIFPYKMLSNRYETGLV